MGFRLDQWFHRELLSLPSKLTRTHDGWKGDLAPRLSVMLVLTGEGLACGPLSELPQVMTPSCLPRMISG